MENIDGLGEKDIETINAIISENVDIIEEEEENGDSEEPYFEEDEEEDESYECPECGHEITVDMANCPSCGVGLSFEVAEEEE